MVLSQRERGLAKERECKRGTNGTMLLSHREKERERENVDGDEGVKR